MSVKNVEMALTDPDRNEPALRNEIESTSLVAMDAQANGGSSTNPPSSTIGAGRRGRCKYCSHAVPVGTSPCPHCGHELKWTKPSRASRLPARSDAVSKPASSPKDETSSLSPIVFGVLSLVACLLPIVGVPLAVIGLVISGSKKSVTGGCLCTLGLVLSIINAVSGGIKGAQAEREYEARKRTEQFIQDLNRILD